MKNAAFRKATALILTMVMLMTCLPAWATESVVSGEDKTIEGSVTEVTTAPTDAIAVQVDATGSGDAALTVTEGVSAQTIPNTEHDPTMAVGAQIEADNGNTATLDVGEDISAATNDDYSGAWGARMKVGEESTASLKAGTIEVTAHGELSSASGLDLSNNAHGLITAEVDGISATSDGEGAMNIGVALDGLIWEWKTEVNVGKGGISVASTGEEGGAWAVDSTSDGDVDIVLNSEGDITAKAAEVAEGVSLLVYNGGSASISSEGKISAETEAGNSYATAADLFAGTGSTVTLEAETIEATAKEDDSEATSLSLRNEVSGTISVTADGISAVNEGDNGSAFGVELDNLINGGTVEINAGEDGISTTANGEHSDAMTVVGQVLGDVTVNSEGDIIAAGTNQAVGISTEIFADSSLTVHVGGGVQATNKSKDGDAMAVYQMLLGGQTDISVDQDVTAAGGKTALGINVGTHDEEASANISVGGDVTAKDAQNTFAIDASGIGGTIKVKTGGNVSAISDGYAAIGVYAFATGKEDITVDVEGSISASANALDNGHGTANSILAIADSDDAGVTITVADGVKAETDGNTDAAVGIYAGNGYMDESGKIDIQVVGDVESTGTGIEVYGTERNYLFKTTTVVESEYDHSEYNMVEGVGIYEEKIYYNAEGDYYYNETGYMWQNPKDTGNGLTRIEVNGDVTADDIGLVVKGEVPADVIIDGTLSGDHHAVVLSQESVADNLTLTVWEIKPNADGSVAEYGQIDANGELQTTEATDVEKEIQYIIRLEQPQAGGSIYTEGTFEYEGYTVAHENDTVILKVNVLPGYDIVDAFNGTDVKVSLMKDANGQYYLVVPRGGAVLLSVKLRRMGTTLPKTCTITVDPNGGTLNGSTEPIVETVGRYQSFTLPDAPKKNGETFLGWFGTPFAAENANWKAPEAGSSKLLPAGSSVKVTGDYFYTAVWKEE